MAALLRRFGHYVPSADLAAYAGAIAARLMRGGGGFDPAGDAAVGTVWRWGGGLRSDKGWLRQVRLERVAEVREPGNESRKKNEPALLAIRVKGIAPRPQLCVYQCN